MNEQMRQAAELVHHGAPLPEAARASLVEVMMEQAEAYGPVPLPREFFRHILEAHPHESELGQWRNCDCRQDAIHGEGR